MKKPDDSTLSQQQYDRVRQEAARLLHKADAFGVFPTPVPAIMEAGRIAVADEDVLDEGFLRGIRKKAGRALKSALSKVLGLIDVRDRLVFIDHTVHAVRQTFLKLHETGHFVLPWQRRLYAVVEDSKRELEPEIADLFEREANIFATEVLFQLDSFIEEAADHDFSIRTPLDLSKKYGASVYAAVRHYVSKNHRACVVLVLEPPELTEGDGFRAALRRPVPSPSFEATYGALDWPNYFTPDDEIGAMVPMHGRRMSRPREIRLVDRNGDHHECIAESFKTPYQVFVLIHAVRTLTKTAFIMPASA